jgi:excisionase family DNA binding protein
VKKAEILSLKEVAHYLNCCERTVIKLVSQGRIKPLPLFERRFSFLKEEIDRFLHEHGTTDKAAA